MASVNREVALNLGVTTSGTDSVEKLVAELNALKAKTDALRTAEAASAAEVSAAKRALDDQREALARLRIQYQTTGGDANKYQGDVLQLKTAILDSRVALRIKQEALTGTSNATKAAAAAERALAIETDAARAKIQSLGDGAKQTEKSVGGLSDAFSQLGPILAAALTGREFVQTIVAAESLKLGLGAVLGSTQAAAAEMAFLKKTSNDLGLELQSSAQQYLSLTAATKGTTLEGEQTRAVFTAVSRAMSVLGKSSIETERALAAVSQMASKGTVAMEELRGQLGEALPGALKAAADGAGITTTQLIKMVENGDVLAKDLLPALAKGLDSIYASGGPPNTLISNFNRFKNSIAETATELGESGLTAALTDVAIVGTKTVGVLGGAFVGLGKGIGETAAAVATMDFGGIADKLGRATFEAKQFEETLYDGAGNVVGVVSKLPPGIEKVGAAAVVAGELGQEAFRKLEIAAQNEGNSVLKNKTAYTEREEAAKRAIELAEKSVKTSESEAKVVTLIAAAFGSETEKREASIFASELQTKAQENLNATKRIDLTVATEKLAALNKENAGIKELDTATKKQKEELEQSVKVKTEDVRISDAQAKALAITTTQIKAADQAYKDNSGSVNELRLAMVLAKNTADATYAAFRQGLATLKDVEAADLAAQQATYLYRDALNDLAVALKLKESALAAQAVTRQKELDLNIEERTTTLQLAKARGDEAAAASAQTEITRAGLNAKREAATATRAQADAERATADAEEAAALASGNLTTEKKAQIEALREAAKQKDLDAQKTDLLASREERLAKATLDTAAAVERAAEAERKRLNVDRDGFSLDKSGNRLVATESQDQLTQRVGEKYGAQLATDPRAIQAANISLQIDQVRASGAYAGTRNSPEITALLAELAKLESELNAARNTVKGTGQTTAGAIPGSAPVAQTGASSSHVITINLGGASTNINVASEQDAINLQGLLQQLAQAKGVSR